MMMSLKKEMGGLVQQQNNYVYIVRCSDQTLYTGWTNHLEKRIEAHNAGKGAKYTKARRPVELVYFETFDNKGDALKREYQIKQLKRSEKEKLAKAKQYKHMTFYEAADMAKRANVQELWLTHFSPSLVRPQEYLPEVQKIFPNAHLGKDGKSVELVFQEE